MTVQALTARPYMFSRNSPEFHINVLLGRWMSELLHRWVRPGHFSVHIIQIVMVNFCNCPYISGNKMQHSWQTAGDSYTHQEPIAKACQF